MASKKGSDPPDGSRRDSPIPGGEATPPGGWALPPTDLSEDPMLRACGTVELESGSHPTLGRIALLARAGKGGMGVVYYGVNPRLGTEVAG